MRGRLFLALTYNVKTDRVGIRATNIKRERLPDVLEAFLHGQIGKGADRRKPIIRSIYHIRLELDPGDDTFVVRSDTGNLGLRDGILMRALVQL